MNHVHFNKDHPENHNIYVASLKDGHVVTFNGERWDVGIADQVLDDIIQQKSDILEDKYDEIVDKLSPMESKKFNNFMNRKDDAKVNLKLKRELRVQLYNNRHFAKDAKKLLEDKEKKIKQNINDGIVNSNSYNQEKEIRKALESLQDKNLGELDPETAQNILNILNSV
jgi:HD-GYP domain-containing protein (c-di-GMP phosphodiesterase class II)